MGNPTTITFDDVDYVRKDSLNQTAEKLDGLDYCMVRTYSAGVFAGYIEERNGKEGVLLNARRMWRWAGAASLSQLASEGTKTPNDCKFPVAVPEVILTEIVEIIPISQKAKDSIDSVPVWSA